MREMKQALAQDGNFISALKAQPLGQEAFQKYLVAVQRIQATEKQRAQKVRQGMNKPRRQFQGCLATKVSPEGYQDCLENFDDPNRQYEKIATVPSALKVSVYEKTRDPELKQALHPTISNPRFYASDLPSGLRQYIQRFPTEFRQYFDERRHELGLLKAVLRSLSPEAKRELRQRYQQQGKIDQPQLMELIQAPKKRKVGQGESNNMFDLEERETYNDDAQTVYSNDTTMTNILDGGCESCY